MKIPALLIFFIAAALCPARAGSLEIYPEKTEVALGEQVSVEFILPSREKTLKDLIPESEHIHVFRKDIRRNTARLLLGVYSLGEAEIPVRLYYIEDGEGREASIPGFKLTVTETDTGEESGIRPLKGAARMLNPLWLILAAAAIALISYLIIRRKKSGAQAAAAEKTPREAALERLMKIREEDLPSLEKFKEHYDAIGDCLRWYMQQKHNFDALGSTLRELRKHLENRLPGSDYTSTVKLLEECDWIKFTPSGRRPENTQKAWEEAYRLIDNDF